MAEPLDIAFEVSASKRPLGLLPEDNFVETSIPRAEVRARIDAAHLEGVPLLVEGYPHLEIIDVGPGPEGGEKSSRVFLATYSDQKPEFIDPQAA